MNLSRLARGVFLAAVGALAGACASGKAGDGFAATDQFESFNRAMLEGNRRVDRFVLRPAAQAYDFVTPATVQHVIGNGLSHIALIPDFANYLLQGDIDRSLNTLGRFTLNTVMGAGGALDPATEFGLAREPTDFGLTLASWGVGEGSYLILPVIGPTTVRDAAGFVIDFAFRPSTYVGMFTTMDGLAPAVVSLGYVDARNRNKKLIDDVLYRSESSYVTIRAAHLQRRRAQVARDKGAADRVPDLFDNTN